MAFKLKTIENLLGVLGEHSTSYVPVFKKKLDSKIAGEANRDKTIFINTNVKKKNVGKVVAHEMGHVLQMMRGELDYDAKNVYWKGKIIPRSSIKEGNPKLPWENEIYKKQKKT